MTLKHLPAEERPRERLARYGGEALSTIELLAILLGSGTKNRSALQLATDLLSCFGSFQALTEASLQELRQIKGVGTAKAIQLKAHFALFHRIEQKQEGLLLDSPQKAYALIRGELAFQKIENLMVVLRNVRRVCIHREIISKGTLTELLVHPREIFYTAIHHRAHSVIIAHNHPSGDPTPSSKDLEMTHILMGASRLLGIELSDHLIVGSGGYTSFFEKGLLGKEKAFAY
jgi:DNA repair protein RadC